MHAFLKIFSIVLLLLLSACLGLYFIPVPPQKLARLAAEQEAYFFQDEDRWLKEHSLTDILWAKALEFKLRRELTSHMSDQLHLNNGEIATGIKASANELRVLFINQTQQEVPVITNSALASMVRGYGYCDQVNGFLALLLSAHLDKVQLFGVRNEKGISPHTLIRSESALGVVWIDAFSCVNAFGFKDELSSSGKKNIPLYEQRAATIFPPSYYKNGSSFNEFGISYTAGKAYARLGKLLTNKTAETTPAPTPEAKPNTEWKRNVIGTKLSRQALLIANLQAEPLFSKQLYLKARVLHLLSEQQEATLLYQELIAQNPDSPLAVYAAIFLERIGGENIPCP